jgi:hypothetical protein
MIYEALKWTMQTAFILCLLIGANGLCMLWELARKGKIYGKNKEKLPMK